MAKTTDTNAGLWFYCKDCDKIAQNLTAGRLNAQCSKAGPGFHHCWISMASGERVVVASSKKEAPMLTHCPFHGVMEKYEESCPYAMDMDAWGAAVGGAPVKEEPADPPEFGEVGTV